VSDCATQKIRFERPTPLALEAAFDGGRLTSDGGLTWLAEVDEELGVCQARWPSTSQSGEPGEDDTLCSRCSNSVSFR
jgi:hypothetical protein